MGEKNQIIRTTDHMYNIFYSGNKLDKVYFYKRQ